MELRAPSYAGYLFFHAGNASNQPQIDPKVIMMHHLHHYQNPKLNQK
jgi:hypothetical protein